MKIAINDRVGGFTLSVKAIIELIKLKSEYIISEPLEESLFSQEEVDKRFTKEIEGYFVDANDCWAPYLIKDNIVYFYHDDRHNSRCDKDVIDVIEKLEKNATCKECAIKIVEIPDNIEWSIFENDTGEEWVAEKHRTWG